MKTAEHIEVERATTSFQGKRGNNLSKGHVVPPLAWKGQEDYLKTLLAHPWYKHLAKISSTIYSATHDFFVSQNIAPFVFPITTGSVSSPMGLGSDSMPVKINLRGHEVFLADSMQFSLEVGARLNSQGAYYIMPTFRGESVDSRHLNEFVHSEVEIPGKLDDIINLAEGYVTSLVESVAKNCEESVATTAGGLAHIKNLLGRKGHAFLRISYEDALKRLEKVDGTTNDIKTGYPTITSKGESELLKEHGDFIWLTNMPWANVPFYQSKKEGTPYSMTGDLLAGIGEILGCGQRVATTKDLKESLGLHRVNIDGYCWYAEMRERMPLQTSGFGLGIERLILWITQTSEIRNCSLLYRDHDQVFYP
jgi:aspartyl/asparaginyl-tRNA synthetase